MLHEVNARFVKRVLDFQCLADRCEDTCCVGLRVPVTEQHLPRMREVVAGGPDAERVATLVRLNPEAPPAERAVIEMRSDGSCPFLDTTRLCSLHRNHGPRVLPDPCVTFPRIVWKWNERVEVAGSIACPEMARRLLLEEGAVELVPGPVEEVPRLEVARPLPGEPEDAYLLHAEALRGAALRMLRRREFPLGSRLALLGQLAFRLDSVFRAEEPFAGSAEQAGEVVTALLQAFDEPEALEAMHQDFSALEIPGAPCAGLLASMLKARRAVARGERFGPFVGKVLSSLWGSEEAAGAPDEAWREYLSRWQRLERLHGPRVEQYFLNYGVNQWLRSPFTEAPSLLAYVFRLALRVAMLRLTLVGHPEVAALCARGQGGSPEPEDSQAVLDRAAVECFYLVSRHVEQAPDVLALVANMAGAGGAETLGKTFLFAKFC
jgi:lysine-N-methylase